jgi:AmmeMemoRadiSam system protein A
VFVTLRRREDGGLRGCIGQVEARDPLSLAVTRAAVLAATRDPRFPPVEASELEGLRLEISVLSPLDASQPEGVEPGLHGVLVSWRGARGLLLPQVASEQGWDREALLDHACLKAGAPAGAWREGGGASLRTFTAAVVSEA